MLSPAPVLAVLGAAVLASALVLSGATSPADDHPGSAPGASPGDLAPAIDWQQGCVRLSADAIRIGAGDRVFTADAPVLGVHSDPGDEAYRTLEVEWAEQELEQRLYVYFAADEDSWWVSELRTRDGFPDADWITYAGPLFETPIGETYEDDVRLSGGTGRVLGSLEIDGLTLSMDTGDPCDGELPNAGVSAETSPDAEPVKGG